MESISLQAEREKSFNDFVEHMEYIANEHNIIRELNTLREQALKENWNVKNNSEKALKLINHPGIYAPNVRNLSNVIIPGYYEELIDLGTKILSDIEQSAYK